jgi:hypothetical protein
MKPVREAKARSRAVVPLKKKKNNNNNFIYYNTTELGM